MRPHGPAILKYASSRALVMQNCLKEEMVLEQLGYIIWDYFFYQNEVIHIQWSLGKSLFLHKKTDIWGLNFWTH